MLHYEAAAGVNNHEMTEEEEEEKCAIHKAATTTTALGFCIAFVVRTRSERELGCMIGAGTPSSAESISTVAAEATPEGFREGQTSLSNLKQAVASFLVEFWVSLERCGSLSRFCQVRAPLDRLGWENGTGVWSCD